MNNSFNEQESLRTIQTMIDQAKNRFQRESAGIQIFWGYLIAILAVSQYFLQRILDPHQASLVWLGALLGIPVTLVLIRRIDRKSGNRTAIDGMTSSVWQAFSFTVIGMLILWSLLPSGQYAAFALLTPAILLLMGIPQYVTARAYRLNPYYWGAVAFWAAGIAAGVPALRDYQLLIMAAAVIAGWALPNHLLKASAQRDV